MSLSIVCLYIIIVLCFLLFVNYKFLKLFITSPNKRCTHDANRNNTKFSNKNAPLNSDDNFNTPQMGADMWSIPGPLRIPFLGTKWIYMWKYKLSQIHHVFRGKHLLFIPEIAFFTNTSDCMWRYLKCNTAFVNPFQNAFLIKRITLFKWSI